MTTIFITSVHIMNFLFIFEITGHSLFLSQYYRSARAAFIIGNVSSLANDDKHRYSSQDPEAIQLEDDHKTLLRSNLTSLLSLLSFFILRFLGAQHICWPDRPICVQLNDGTTRHLVTEMGAYHV